MTTTTKHDQLNRLMDEMTNVLQRFASHPPSDREMKKLRQALLLIRRVLTAHCTTTPSAANNELITRFHRLQFEARPWLLLQNNNNNNNKQPSTTIIDEDTAMYVLYPPDNSTCLNPRLDVISCTGNGLTDVLVHSSRHGPAGISTINVSHLEKKKSKDDDTTTDDDDTDDVVHKHDIAWDAPVIPMAAPLSPSVLNLSSPVCEGSQCVLYVRPSFEAALLSSGRRRTSYMVVQADDLGVRGPDILVVAHAESQLQPMVPIAYVNVTPPARSGDNDDTSALTLYVKLPPHITRIGPFISLYMMNRRRRRAISHCIRGLWLIHVNEGGGGGGGGYGNGTDSDGSAVAYPPTLMIDTAATTDDDGHLGVPSLSSQQSTPAQQRKRPTAASGGGGGGGGASILSVASRSSPKTSPQKKTLPSPAPQKPALTPVNVAPEWQALNATLSHIEVDKAAVIVGGGGGASSSSSSSPVDALLPMCQELPTELLSLLKMIFTRPLYYVELIQKACESNNSHNPNNGSDSMDSHGSNSHIRSSSTTKERRGRFEMAVLLNHLLNAFVINQQPMLLFSPLLRHHEGVSSVADADALLHAYSPLAILISLFLTEHCTVYLRDVLSKPLQEIFEHFMTHSTASYEINPLQLQVRRPELRSKSSALRTRSETIPLNNHNNLAAVSTPNTPKLSTASASANASGTGGGGGGGGGGGVRHVADILTDNAALMSKHYSLIMDRVVASVSEIQKSPYLHALLIELCKLARPKKPDVPQQKIARALLSSALFSRFMCLAIINPTSSYVLPESLQLPPRLVRGLLLMAKCVQSTGNLTRFEENDTDQYMMVMNDVIARYFPKVKKVYRDITTMPVLEPSSATATSLSLNSETSLDELQLSLEALRIFLTRQSNAHLDLPDIEMDMDSMHDTNNNNNDNNGLKPYPLELSSYNDDDNQKPMAIESPPPRKRPGFFARLFGCGSPQ